MGRAAGTLGSVLATAVEGPTTTKSAEGPAAAGLAVEGPAAEVGPWRTCGLKE